MILEIDVGNTLLKWRALDGDVVQSRGRYPTPQLAAAMPVDWPAAVSQVRISNVAGPIVAGLLKAYVLSRWQIEPIYAVTRDYAAGVTNSYSDPSRMGVDRWLAMLAAFNACHEACCVVDCGSAITVDYVVADGCHEGGYIIPGMRLMSEGLQRSTAEVLVDRSIDQFELAPGRHTSAAVTHGINFAFSALQEKILMDVRERGMRLYITGGDGVLFHELAEEGVLAPDLVLDGLGWSLSEI